MRGSAPRDGRHVARARAGSRRPRRAAAGCRRCAARRRTARARASALARARAARREHGARLDSPSVEHGLEQRPRPPRPGRRAAPRAARRPRRRAPRARAAPAARARSRCRRERPRARLEQVDDARAGRPCPRCRSKIGYWSGDRRGAAGASSRSAPRAARKSAPARSQLVDEGDRRARGARCIWRQTVSDWACTPATRVDHEDRAVEHAHAALDLDREVDVARACRSG